MSRLDEQLSEEFHRWEQRGRGWQLFSQPVEPDPPFIPFHGHFLPLTPIPDDGVKNTFLSSLVQLISRKLSTERPSELLEPETEEEPEPTPLIRESLVELQASLPADFDLTREAFEQFLLNLSHAREPIAFELLGIPNRVVMQFAVHSDDVSLVHRQLQAHFPEGLFQRREGYLEKVWHECQGEEALAVEFGLAQEFMLPLATGKLDPFVGIVGALSELKAGELGLFQVLFQQTSKPWAESIVRSVTHADGKPFFINQPELTSAAEKKVTRPLFAAVVRIAIRTTSFERTLQLARDLAGSLRVFAHPQGNELIPLENSNYPFEDHIEDVVRRQSRRSGMVLNSEELIGFVHLPSSAVRSAVLLRDSGKTKAAPTIVRQPSALMLGDNEHAGEIVPVFLSVDQRVRHMHIIGSSGMGKSSLLLNLIRQDIECGNGVAVLDPHGDLIDQILGIIPTERIDDVVLVNPSDVEFPVGFNILQAHSEEEKTLLASDLISLFRRLSTSWGDQMDAVLQNAILAFLESKRGGTLADLRRFLLEPPFRAEFLQTVQDPELIYYWQKVFPQLSGGKSIGPVLTRLQDFFSRKPLRNMVSQPENKLDFANIMDSGKIFLAKLSEGLLGKENSYLLGSLLISKFQQLAMARQAQNITARRDFWIYIDEFYNFITPSMAEILQGARKYRIGLTLAHHNLRQLQKEPEVASAVMTHPCARVVFQVGDEDAKKLGDCFEFFDAKSLKSLEKYHSIARVERNDFDFNLAFPKPELPDKEQAEKRKNEVIAASRAKYAVPRSVVEEALFASVRDRAQPAESSKPVEPSAPKPAIPSTPNVAEKKATEVPKSKEIASSELTDTDATDSQHTAIKNQIGAEARRLDYSASFEEAVQNGLGRIDLVLRRGNQAIACEVSVTNTLAYEVKNALKCLQAGFQEVAVICRSRKKLTNIQQRLTETNSNNDCSNVKFYSPEEFIAKLYDWAEEDPESGVMEKGKPRKQDISLNVGQLTESERKQREKEMLESLKKAMKRKPGT